MASLTARIDVGEPSTGTTIFMNLNSRLSQLFILASMGGELELLVRKSKKISRVGSEVHLADVHSVLPAIILPLGHAHGGAMESIKPPGATLALLSVGAGTTEEVFSMCDYSLHSVKSRAAKVGDKPTTQNGTPGTRGLLPRKMPARQFVFCQERSSLLPKAVRCSLRGLSAWKVTDGRLIQRLSSGKSTSTTRGHIMMRWNFLMGRPCG